VPSAGACSQRCSQGTGGGESCQELRGGSPERDGQSFGGQWFGGIISGGRRRPGHKVGEISGAFDQVLDEHPDIHVGARRGLGQLAGRNGVD
jgi:hypothetical protein